MYATKMKPETARICLLLSPQALAPTNGPALSKTVRCCRLWNRKLISFGQTEGMATWESIQWNHLNWVQTLLNKIGNYYTYAYLSSFQIDTSQLLFCSLCSFTCLKWDQKNSEQYHDLLEKSMLHGKVKNHLNNSWFDEVNCDINNNNSDRVSSFYIQ